MSVKGPCILKSPAGRGQARCKALETLGTSFKALWVRSGDFVAWPDFMLPLILLSSKYLAKMEQIKMKRQCSSLQIIFLFHIKRSHCWLWALWTAEGDSKFYVMGGKRGLAFLENTFWFKKENLLSLRLQKHCNRNKNWLWKPLFGLKRHFF